MSVQLVQVVHPIQWSSDSSSFFVYDRNQLPASVYKVNWATGQRTLFKVLTPPDRGILYRQGATEVDT